MLPIFLLSIFAGLIGSASGHATAWSPAMWGFNVTGSTFSYDNRPVVPLMHLTFKEWWFHGHLDYPPPDNTFLELPAGGTLNSQVSCDKGATTFFASSPGGDIQAGNNPCPGSPTIAFHAKSIEDTRGCAFGITYKSDVNSVKPEDFTIFTVNHTCVWHRFTDFQIPADMPECPEGGCICSFNWIHAPDAGSEQIYMNGYRCKVTNAKSNKKLATPKLARRCGQNADKNANVAPWNCTYGAKQALYWLQKEGNTFFEGDHDPPFYNDLYNFGDGAQNDIFEDSQLPVFNNKGEQTGFTTPGGNTATTANIVTPTVSSGWPTTTTAASGQPTGGSSSNSGSGSSSAANPVNTPVNNAAGPANGTNNSSSKSATTSTSTSRAGSSTATSTTKSSSTSKCRRRDNAEFTKIKRRAFSAHQKLSKRHGVH